MSVPQFVPPWGWAQEMLGLSWPQGDEDALRRCGAAWQEACDSLLKAAGHGNDVVSKVNSAITSVSCDEFNKYWSKYVKGDGILEQLAGQCAAMANYADAAALQIEATKISENVVAVILYIQILEALAEIAASLGLDTPLVAVQMAAERWAAQSALRMLIKGLIEALAFTLLPDLISETVQMVEGHRAWGDYDGSLLLHDLEHGILLGGLFALPGLGGQLAKRFDLGMPALAKPLLDNSFAKNPFVRKGVGVLYGGASMVGGNAATYYADQGIQGLGAKGWAQGEKGPFADWQKAFLQGMFQSGIHGAKDLVNERITAPRMAIDTTGGDGLLLHRYGGAIDPSGADGLTVYRAGSDPSEAPTRLGRGTFDGNTGTLSVTDKNGVTTDYQAVRVQTLDRGGSPTGSTTYTPSEGGGSYQADGIVSHGGGKGPLPAGTSELYDSSGQYQGTTVRNAPAPDSTANSTPVYDPAMRPVDQGAAHVFQSGRDPVVVVAGDGHTVPPGFNRPLDPNEAAVYNYGTGRLEQVYTYPGDNPVPPGHQAVFNPDGSFQGVQPINDFMRPQSVPGDLSAAHARAASGIGQENPAGTTVRADDPTAVPGDITQDATFHGQNDLERYQRQYAADHQQAAQALSEQAKRFEAQLGGGKPETDQTLNALTEAQLQRELVGAGAAQATALTTVGSRAHDLSDLSGGEPRGGNGSGKSGGRSDSGSGGDEPGPGGGGRDTGNPADRLAHAVDPTRLVDPTLAGDTRPENRFAVADQVDWARRIYDAVRRTPGDAEAIVQHLAQVPRPDGGVGYTRAEIDQIRDRLFLSSHDLGDGKTTLIDPEVAAAWQRLSTGRAEPRDLTLLDHELAKDQYLQTHRDATYAEARDAANKTADWESTLPPDERQVFHSEPAPSHRPWRSGGAYEGAEEPQPRSDPPASPISSAQEARLGAMLALDFRDGAAAVVDRLRTALATMAGVDPAELESTFHLDRLGSGTVPADVTVDELIADGNTRELMTAVFAAGFASRDPHCFDRLVLDLARHNALNRFEAAKLDVKALRDYIDFLQRRLNRWPEPRDFSEAGNLAHFFSPGSDTARDLQDPNRRFPRTDKNDPKHLIPLRELEQNGIGLSSREITDLLARARDDRAIAENYQAGRAPFSTGESSFVPATRETQSPWFQRNTLEGDMPAVAGPSGTTVRLYAIAKFLRLPADLAEDFAGAVTGYLVSSHHHSMSEVVQALDVLHYYDTPASRENIARTLNLDNLYGKVPGLVRREPATPAADSSHGGTPTEHGRPLVPQIEARPPDLNDPAAQLDWAHDAYTRLGRHPDPAVADAVSEAVVKAVVKTLEQVPRGDGRVGYSAHEVARVHEYTFRATHKIADGVGGEIEAHFDADPEIAAAWRRMASGEIDPRDLMLLDHELAEMDYLRDHPGATLLDAHRAANEVANWENTVPDARRKALYDYVRKTFGDPGLLQEDGGGSGDGHLLLGQQSGPAGPRDGHGQGDIPAGAGGRRADDPVHGGGQEAVRPQGGHRPVAGGGNDRQLNRPFQSGGAREPDGSHHGADPGPGGGHAEDRAAALARAALTRTDTGGFSPEAVQDLLNGLPNLPDASAASLRAFVESVFPGEVRLEQVTNNAQRPVYRAFVDDALVGYIKILPRGTDFAAELSAADRLHAAELTSFQVPDVLAVAGVSDADGGRRGVLFSSPAPGDPVDLLMRRVPLAWDHEAAMNDLRKAVVGVAEGMAELHRAGDRQASADYLTPHVDAIRGHLERLEANRPVLERLGIDLDQIRTALDATISAAQDDPGPASLAHGDAHLGNFLWDPETGVSIIDAPTLHDSMDAAGEPIGSPARDVALFDQRLGHFGDEFGLSKAEIGELREAFHEAYTRAGGPTVPEHVRTLFDARAAAHRLARAVHRLMTHRDPRSAPAVGGAAAALQHALGLDHTAASHIADGFAGELPGTPEFRRDWVAIDNFRSYMLTAADPATRARFEAELGGRIADLQARQTKEFKDLWADLFRSKAEESVLPPGGGRRAEGVIRTLTAEADRLVTDLAAFAAETGIPALAHGVAPRTIDREGTAAWEASFREIQSKIDEIIADFRFRGEPVGYIGSMKSGWRGPHKGKTRFDPNDFDVDLYVVVDKATFDEIAGPYRSLLSKDGTKLMPDAGDPPEIVRLGKEIGRALKAAFPHVRGIEDSVIALRSEQPW